MNKISILPIFRISCCHLQLCAKDLKDFTIVNGKLYFDEVMSLWPEPCAQSRLKENFSTSHDHSCVDNDISFYKLLQRQWYYWLDMAKEAVMLHSSCSQCQETFNMEESFLTQEAGDWKQPYLDFLSTVQCQQITLM